MATYNLRYSFRQRFRVGARRAFTWCTDFDPGDHALEGTRGQRQVTWITPETAILTDRFPAARGGTVEKVKLVRVDRATLRWTSTHLTGPAQFSQFWYHIVPVGAGRSHLDYEGFELRRARTVPSPARIASEARRLGREDSASWRRLAQAMERELLR